jgi:hypothetical protein
MELDTRQRPTTQAIRDDRNSPDVLYFHSYLLTRTVIGAIGVLLPLTLMLIEGAFTKHGLRPRTRSAPTTTRQLGKMSWSAASVSSP